MHFGDTIFIFLLALVVFGPKKLPEIGRQIGKLMVEFRRASNDFKLQIEEELRSAEQADRQKTIAAEEAAAAAAAPASLAEPSILPPSEGSSVSQSANFDGPYADYNQPPVSSDAQAALASGESPMDAAELLAAVSPSPEAIIDDPVAEAAMASPPSPIEEAAMPGPETPTSPNTERYYGNGSSADGNRATPLNDSAPEHDATAHEQATTHHV